MVSLRAFFSFLALTREKKADSGTPESLFIKSETGHVKPRNPICNYLQGLFQI